MHIREQFAGCESNCHWHTQCISILSLWPLLCLKQLTGSSSESQIMACRGEKRILSINESIIDAFEFSTLKFTCSCSRYSCCIQSLHLFLPNFLGIVLNVCSNHKSLCK